MLGLALMSLDNDLAARALAARAAYARTPRRWRAVHSRLDRAAAALAGVT